MYSRIAFFKLLGGPSFSKDSELIRVTLNDRVEFNCNPTSVPPVIGFVWMKDGIDIPDMSNQSIFIIEETSYDDEGVYSCIANNKFNNGSKRFELKVRSEKFLIIPVHICFIIILYRSTYTIVASPWHNNRTVSSGCYNFST